MYYVIYALVNAVKEDHVIFGTYDAVGYHTDEDFAFDEAQALMQSHRFQPVTTSTLSEYPIDFYSPDKTYGVKGLPKLFISASDDRETVIRAFVYENNVVVKEDNSYTDPVKAPL